MTSENKIKLYMINSLSTILETFKGVFRNLLLSLISVDFYRDVIRGFKGYGLQYTLNLSLFAAMLCCVHILYFNDKLANYLQGGNIADSRQFNNLDYVISQLPEIDYDGQTINIQANDPIKISDPNGKVIIAIDPEKKLKPSEKHNIPLVMQLDNFILKMTAKETSSNELFKLDYNFLFGKEPGLITPETFKMRLLDISNNLPSTLIFLFFPALMVVIFANSVLNKVFIVLMIFLISNILLKKLPLSVCFRLILYASGIVILLQPVADLAIPQLGQNLWLVQLWTNLLMINALIKER